MQKIIIFGATSAIAHACARTFTEKAEPGEKPSFILIGRHQDRLEINAKDLQARGAIKAEVLSIQDWSDEGVVTALESANTSLGGYDTLWLFHAIMGEVPSHDANWAEVREMFELNTMSYLRLMHRAANDFTSTRRGTLLVCSSVAADRGRVKNCWYAATKGPLDMVVEALRQRFVSMPAVKLLTLKPGLIDTPLTANVKKGLLCSTPEVVANTTYSLYKRGFEVIYAPWYWVIIMSIVCLVPRPIFKRMKF